ncbi:MAG: hypothetical protein LBP59_14020 [Planctomycetaceae bacterium]|nr:hypothetical protein [Planctomycetaceae bacterium]
MSEVLILSAFLFALRQSAGGTPAIRWSRMLFRIAGISPMFLPGSQARHPRSFGLRFALKTIHRLRRLERYFLK